jgi:hypothetical protein
MTNENQCSQLGHFSHFWTLQRPKGALPSSGRTFGFKQAMFIAGLTIAYVAIIGAHIWFQADPI